MLIFATVMLFLTTLLFLWGLYLSISDQNWHCSPNYFMGRRRSILGCLLAVLPWPLRSLLFGSIIAMFCGLMYGGMRWIKQKTPLLEFRENGILAFRPFRTRFDAWDKVLAIEYLPKHDKYGKVSHQFDIKLRRYRPEVFPTTHIVINEIVANFNAKAVLNVLRSKRPDLIADLFVAEDRPSAASRHTSAPKAETKRQTTEPAIHVSSNQWTG